MCARARMCLSLWLFSARTACVRHWSLFSRPWSWERQPADRDYNSPAGGTRRPIERQARTGPDPARFRPTTPVQAEGSSYVQTSHNATRPRFLSSATRLSTGGPWTRPSDPGLPPLFPHGARYRSASPLVDCGVYRYVRILYSSPGWSDGKHLHGEPCKDATSPMINSHGSQVAMLGAKPARQYVGVGGNGRREDK